MSLDHFEIIRKLGEGAFSCVYKVNRKSDGQAYALKKVKMGNLSMKEKENALNEIRIMASFSHPNIIAYKEAFIDESSNTLCIVMELAEGGDLMKKITTHKKENSNFPELEIWCTLVQIANGLKILHAGNIIHRDLKCANIFISKEGTIKLGDLNVSKVNKKGLAYTQTGTPYYASPEVWKDKPYTFSSDIWSLGCVIYEIAALEPPFTANDMQGLYKKIIKGEYPSMPQIYSESLSRVIRLLLQVNPSSRPTCEQILEIPSVQRYINLNPSSTQDPANLLQTIKFETSIKNLKNKLPSPKYGDNRGMSANSKLIISSSNRELSAMVNPEIYRNYSLNSRESPKPAIVNRKNSLEALERHYKYRNLVRLDSSPNDILNNYQLDRPMLISPENYPKKVEDILNRKANIPKPRPMNKIGMMIIDTPKGPPRLAPLVKSPSLNELQNQKEPALHYLQQNPVWLG